MFINKSFQPGDLSSDAPDTLLVQHTLQGNYEAFAHLVKRYHSILREYISYWCPDPYLVPDIEQDTLLRLYLSLSILHTEQPLRAWLLRVAYSACMNERRRQKPLLFSQFDRISSEEVYSWLATLPDPDPLQEDLIEQQERYAVVRRAIKTLPPGQRMAIWLKYMDQLSYSDIARRLNIPEGTAKTNVARAKPLLRRFLAPEIEEEAARF